VETLKINQQFSRYYGSMKSICMTNKDKFRSSLRWESDVGAL